MRYTIHGTSQYVNYRAELSDERAQQRVQARREAYARKAERVGYSYIGRNLLFVALSTAGAVNAQIVAPDQSDISQDRALTEIVRPQPRAIHPMRVLAVWPRTVDVSVSPTGKYAGVIVQSDPSVVSLVVFRTDFSSREPVSTMTVNGEYLWTRWADGERTLLAVESRERVNRTFRAATQLFVHRADGSRTKALDPSAELGYRPASQTMVVDMLPDDPDHVLIAYFRDRNDGSGRYRVLYRLGISPEPGAVTLERYSPRRRNAQQWYLDHQDIPRLVTEIDGTTIRMYHRAPEAQRWDQVAEFKVEDRTIFEPVLFDAVDLDLLYVASTGDDGIVGLYGYRISTGSIEHELFVPEKPPEIFDVVQDPGRSEIHGVRYGSAPEDVVWFNDTQQKLIENARQKLPGWDLRIASSSLDYSVLALLATASDRPGRYYLYWPETGQVVDVGSVYPALQATSLSHLEYVHFRASDGAERPGFLNLPGGISNPPADPLPTVVIPYGDTDSKDHSRFAPLVQMLTSKGIAVFQMNYFRVPTFFHPGYRTWHPEDHHDVAISTRWLIDEGISDPARVCIYGEGGGGFAVLSAVIENPGLYACVVSVNGINDLRELKNQFRYSNYRQPVYAMLGDVRNRYLNTLSPVSRAEEINIPVLLVHDKTIPINRAHPVSQSNNMARALQNAGVDHSLVLLEDSGRNEQHRFLSMLDGFFTDNLQ